MKPEDSAFETRAIRNQLERTQYREHSVPIFPTSSFVFDSPEQARAMFAGEEDGYIYSRYSNPNGEELIRKLCDMERCDDGIATASGMAAMFSSIAAFVRSGDHVVSSRAVFGSTHQILTQILPRWGVEYTYVDAKEPDAWERAIRPNTKMLFAETPSNPGLDLIDLAALGEIATRRKVILNIDNCFATPYLQNPAVHGASIVTHSATKFIDGQGRVIAGAILGTKELIEEVRFFTRHTGPALSPFNAWILSKSLETLAVRMDRHCENALALARFLESSSDIVWVKYPELASHPQHELAMRQMKKGGGVVTFEVAGGLDRGRRFLESLGMISLSANLGDARSIATHPASTTHSKLSDADRDAVGITPGLVRISVGLEHPEDIIDDVRQALDRSR